MAHQLPRLICPPYVNIDSKMTPEQAVSVLSQPGLGKLQRYESQGASYKQAPLRYSKASQWLFDLLLDAAMRAREHAYPFSFAGFAEPLLLTCYECHTLDQHPWRMDAGAGATSSRKLTLVAELEPPSAYQGGQTEVFGPRGSVMVPPQLLGSVTVFPAYAVHRVHPVRAGVRWTLTGYLSGPAFV